MPKINIVATDDFAEIRQALGYYVDKTGFIEEFLQNPADSSKFRVPSDATLFTRPRRFGKTLFLSMLAEFFDINKDSHKLFEGLAVSANKALCDQWMNKYPVLFLTLKDSTKKPAFERALAHIHVLIRTFCNQHKYLLSSDRVSDEDKDSIRQYLGSKTDEDTLELALQVLTRALSCYHGKPTIVLIDDYDAPVAKAADNGYYREMVDFMRNFLLAGLKSNFVNLKFGILTGCLIMSYESTGLNNLCCNDITKVSPYADVFGFTQDEVDKILCEAGFPEKRAMIRQWYDGYRFGNRTGIYCPWDIMNYLGDLQRNKETIPQPYWVKTSENALLKRLFQGKEQEMADDIALFLAGECLVKKTRRVPAFESRDSSPDNLWTLLYMAGYLTRASRERAEAQNVIPNPSGNLLPLVIPNGEIRNLFLREYCSWFRKRVGKARENAFFAAFWQADADCLKRELEALLKESGQGRDSSAGAGLSSFSLGLLLGYFLAACPKTLSCRKLDIGEHVICVLDDREKAGARAAIVKIRREYSARKDLAALAEDGRAQIGERKYDVRLLSDSKVRTLLYWSIVFCEKRCEVRAVIVRQQ